MSTETEIITPVQVPVAGIITAIGMQRFAEAILSLCDKCVVTLDGIPTHFEIYRTVVKDGTIKIFYMIGNEYSGHISHVALLNKQGEVIVECDQNVDKPSTRGIAELFEFRLVEVAIYGGI